MRILITAFVLNAALCCHASACLNDKALPQREGEFRSQYSLPQMTRSRERQRPSSTRSTLFAATGIALLGVVAGVTIAAKRQDV
ncbi:MAG: hypothetical protein ACO3FE_00220 [Planctomycetaceae bacterium]